MSQQLEMEADSTQLAPTKEADSSSHALSSEQEILRGCKIWIPHQDLGWVSAVVTEPVKDARVVVSLDDGQVCLELLTPLHTANVRSTKCSNVYNF